MKSVSASQTTGSKKRKVSGLNRNTVFKRFWKTRFLFFLFIPTLLYYILFKYVPMWGVRMAFYEYNLFQGWKGSTFIGLDKFFLFFESPMFWMITKNTLLLGFQDLIFAFPVTIIFALLLNEIRNLRFKKIVQTVSYLPHFLSTVIVCGIVASLCDPVSGGINLLIKALGGEPIYFLTKKEWFRPIYLISGIWQSLGWSTIVYLAAISSVDPGLYEAARLDGAGRFRQMWSITLPSITPTISTMLILKVGHIMDASLEKVLLLQQPSTYESSQVISTYIYMMGFGSQKDYGLSTAVSLYSSLINLVLLLCANWASKKLTDNGIF